MKRRRGTEVNRTRVRACAVCLVAATTAMAAGCGTVGFKRGAGGSAMPADEAACRAQSSDPTAFRLCMRERGWAIAGSPGAPTEVVSEPEGARTDSSSSMGAGSQTSAAASSDAPASTERPATQAEPLPPLTTIRVDSWWKLGGTTADFDRALAACVATLGEEHRPPGPPTLVTIALHDCLKASKWHALGGSRGEGE